jgi:hypothetical protein
MTTIVSALLSHAASVVDQFVEGEPRNLVINKLQLGHDLPAVEIRR